MPQEGNGPILVRWGAYATSLAAILTLLFMVFPNLRPHQKSDDASPPPVRQDVESPPVKQDVESPPVKQDVESPPVKQDFNPPPVKQGIASLPRKGDVILGTWQQYGLNPTSEQWEYWGTFTVVKIGDVYNMSARQQQESPELANSLGIDDIRSDGDSWSFISKQTGGITSEFDLRRLSDTQFEGTISVDGQVTARTKWTKLE